MLGLVGKLKTIEATDALGGPVVAQWQLSVGVVSLSAKIVGHAVAVSQTLSTCHRLSTSDTILFVVVY